MKRTILFALLIACITAGAQSITDKINDQLNNSGCGVANLAINYTSANYWSRESVLVFKDSASSSTVKIHASFLDSNKVNIDTSFVLNATQLNNLLNFYQSAKSNTNPDPSLSPQNTGNAYLNVTIGCGGINDVQYNSPAHISTYRTITANWSNWYQ